MSGFNGSGTFQISGVGLPYVSGTTISSSVANTLNTDLAAGLTNCITKDGQQVLTANIPFNNYKITGLGVGSAATDSANVYNIQCNTGAFITATGTDTIVGTATPALTSGYVAGMQFQFFSAGANTGAVTLNINSQGAKAITKNGTTALVAGDIPSGVLVTVTYDGTQFVLNNQTTFGSLTITGDISVSGNSTVTGNLTVSGTVTAPNLFTGMKNRIINGAMVIDQRNAGTAVTVTAASTDYYAVDRFFANRYVNQPAYTVQQISDAPSGFRSSFKITAGTAFAGDATSSAEFAHIIEGFNLADLNFGLSSALAFTFSFWVKSSLTGTFSINLRNATDNRVYPTTFTINAANTWEYKTITITADTSGTWNTTNGRGLFISVILQTPTSGSSLTANQWQTPPASYSFNSSTMVLRTTGATLQFTGVQLEKGSVATNFEYRPIGLESTLCQRYYEYTLNTDDAIFWSGNTTSGYNYYQTQYFMTPKRANPTITLYGNEGSNGYPAVPTITVGGNASPYGFRVASLASGTNSGSYYRCYWTASAEL